MNLTYVGFKNLFSYEKVELPLESSGLYLLLGKNGVGKSAFREGVTWCLFGESRYGNKPDAVIKDGEDSCESTIRFQMEDEGIEYELTRKRGRGKVTKLECNQYQGQTMKETQQYIYELLGMDYNVFKNTACFEQGGADSFSKLTPKEAKEVLLSLLQLGVYEKACDRAKEKLRAINTRVSTLAGQKEILESTDSEEDEVVVRKRVEQAREYIVAEEKRRVAMEKEILDLDLEITKYDTERVRLKEALNIFTREKVTPVETRLGDVQRQITRYKLLEIGDPCPTCQQELNKEHIEKLLSELGARKMKGEGILKNFQADAASKRLDMEASVPPGAVTNTYNKLKEKMQKALLPNIAEANSNIGRDEGILAQMAKGKEKAAKISEELVIETKRQGTYEKLVEAFGKNGIPAFIIENAKPEIEEVTNMLLGTLTDGEFKVSIATEKELKSGKSKDTLDIMISNGVYERPYIGYSGGEKFLVDFCLRVALSVILSNRHNARVQTLIIDEGLGSLDDVNRRKFALAVQQVFRMFSFKKCFLITHATDVQDSLGEKMYISKENGASTITINPSPAHA